MKLLTKKETDKVFDLYSILLFEDGMMNEEQFNKAVNHILHDDILVKKFLKRVTKIKAKLSWNEKEYQRLKKSY